MGKCNDFNNPTEPVPIPMRETERAGEGGSGTEADTTNKETMSNHLVVRKESKPKSSTVIRPHRLFRYGITRQHHTQNRDPENMKTVLNTVCLGAM